MTFPEKLAQVLGATQRARKMAQQPPVDYIGMYPEQWGAFVRDRPIVEPVMNLNGVPIRSSAHLPAGTVLLYARGDVVARIDTSWWSLQELSA